MPRAFTHPAWWSALALLLVNDHVLKGGALVPGAVTGKLSDFAGMIVAPPLVALLFGAARSGIEPALRGGAMSIARARFAATALVGGGFALIKIWPDAARALEHALGLLGLRARVWVDPLDLLALAVLPLGHWLSRPMAAAARARSVHFCERVGVALAAVACLATTGGGDDEKKTGSSDLPQLENDTGETLIAVVASTEGAGGCGLYRDDRITALTNDAFVAPRELTLEDEARAALSEGQDSTECGAASIRLPDGESVVVFWRDLDAIESFAPADDERWMARRVVVSGGAGHYDVEIGDDLSTFELGGEPPESDCPEPEVTYSLEWTALAEAQGFYEIGELREGDDGCLEVDWFMLEGDTSPDTQRLCIPDWAFPFAVGEALSVVQTIDPRGERVLRIAHHDGDELETELVIWNDATEFEGGRVSALHAVDCVGARTECGAYVRPVELDIRGRDEPLQSGEEATVEGSTPEETLILVGAARDVAWSGATCAGPEARVGASASVLELRRY